MKIVDRGSWVVDRGKKDRRQPVWEMDRRPHSGASTWSCLPTFGIDPRSTIHDPRSKARGWRRLRDSAASRRGHELGAAGPRMHAVYAGSRGWSIVKGLVGTRGWDGGTRTEGGGPPLKPRWKTGLSLSAFRFPPSPALPGCQIAQITISAVRSASSAQPILPLVTAIARVLRALGKPCGRAGQGREVVDRGSWVVDRPTIHDSRFTRPGTWGEVKPAGCVHDRWRPVFAPRRGPHAARNMAKPCRVFAVTIQERGFAVHMFFSASRSRPGRLCVPFEAGPGRENCCQPGPRSAWPSRVESRAVGCLRRRSPLVRQDGHASRGAGRVLSSQLSVQFFERSLSCIGTV